MSNEKLLNEPDYEFQYNTKLYEFLATNYDISSLARKISAAKYAETRLFGLKKIANGFA